MIPVIFGNWIAAMTADGRSQHRAGRTDRALRVAWTGSLAAAGIVCSNRPCCWTVFPDL